MAKHYGNCQNTWPVNHHAEKYSCGCEPVRVETTWVKVIDLYCAKKPSNINGGCLTIDIHVIIWDQLGLETGSSLCAVQQETLMKGILTNHHIYSFDKINFEKLLSLLLNNMHSHSQIRRPFLVQTRYSCMSK